MQIIVGNDTAIEGYYDPSSPTPDKVLYRLVDGQLETTFIFPAEIGPFAAIQNMTHALAEHMTGKPRWVEGDNPELVKMAREHFGVDGKPKLWGASAVDQATDNERRKPKIKGDA